MPACGQSSLQVFVEQMEVVTFFSSFRPAPFFVLDEVDAALDNTNIGKVSVFLLFISNGMPTSQCPLSKSCLITVGYKSNLNSVSTNMVPGRFIQGLGEPVSCWGVCMESREDYGAGLI